MIPSSHSMTPSQVWLRLLVADSATLALVMRDCPELAPLGTTPERCDCGLGLFARLSARSARLDAVLEPCFDDGRVPAHALVLDLCGAVTTPVANEVERATQPLHLHRVRQLVALAERVTAHVVSVVVPNARVSWNPAEFVKRNQDDAAANRVVGEDTLKTLEWDTANRWVRTRGLIVYGLPDLGLAADEVSAPHEAFEILNPLAADLMTSGGAPTAGEERTLAGRRWRVSRDGLGVWLEPVDASPTARERSDDANAAATFNERACAQVNATLYIRATTEQPPGDLAPEHSVDVLVREAGGYVTTTNGLAARPRPGFDDDEGRLELFIDSPSHGPPLVQVLNLLARVVFNPSLQPVRLFDRLPFEDPNGVIAGFLLTPQQRIVTVRGRSLRWCEAIPFTSVELAQLRAGTLTGPQLAATCETPQGRQARWALWQRALANTSPSSPRVWGTGNWKRKLVLLSIAAAGFLYAFLSRKH